MKYKLFIGIDISKKTIDVSLKSKGVKELLHNQFKNNKKGFVSMIKWIKSITNVQENEMFFCMEHTGIYALNISCFLSERNIDYRLENPYHLKHSMGIQRGKNDKADSKMIARYAYMHHEELELTKFSGTEIINLQNLLAHRDRLIKTKILYKVAPKELTEFSDKKHNTCITDSSCDIVQVISEKIKLVEQEIKNLISNNEGLKKNFELACSVKGIGLVIAAYMLVYTQNFTSITKGRCFASYSGVAPFGESSGTSINKSPHVSHLANKKMKSLLNNGAWVAVKYDKELKTYYNRKIKEGKHELVVINAVRNKLISRVFATVKRGTPYVELLQYYNN